MKIGRMFKGISALALSLAIGCGALGVTALAADSTCQHNHASCDVLEKDIRVCYWQNPTCHRILADERHFCNDCQAFHSGTYEYFEDHDYIMDYSTNTVTCSVCGDSYPVY